MDTFKVSPPVPAPVADCSWSSPTVVAHGWFLLVLATCIIRRCGISSVQFPMDLLRQEAEASGADRHFAYASYLVCYSSSAHIM